MVSSMLCRMMGVLAGGSGESLGDGLAGSPPDFGDILACEGVLVLDFDLVDQIGADVLLLEGVHQVDFDRVIAG